MKSIIIGINGQDGYYLSNLLRLNKIEVFGLDSTPGTWLTGDVGNFEIVQSLIKSYKPDYLFHFAAISTTKHEALFDNHSAISTGTLNILESVKLHSPGTKVFLSGSAMQFKNKGVPIDEQTPFDASSPYSVARIHSIYSGRYFRNSFGLKVYAGYFFNHDSPLRTEQHLNQKIAATAKRVAKGSQEKLEIGNIEVQKEFNFAGDIVEAIWALVNQEQIFEAVIGSGEAHSIREWIEYCFKKVGLKWQDFVIPNKNFIPEYEILVSNPKLIKSIGWKPKNSFNQLADLMMGNTGA
ncbi:MAG: GDP-mannose 4,6-dehydratase [Lentisphaerota bacterium]